MAQVNELRARYRVGVHPRIHSMAPLAFDDGKCAEIALYMLGASREEARGALAVYGYTGNGMRLGVVEALERASAGYWAALPHGEAEAEQALRDGLDEAARLAGPGRLCLRIRDISCVGPKARARLAGAIAADLRSRHA